MDMDSNITFAAQKQAYDPWNIPDTFTIYQFAPEDIRHYLHPHWHNQKTPHPVWFYFLGLYFTFLGKHNDTEWKSTDNEQPI